MRIFLYTILFSLTGCVEYPHHHDYYSYYPQRYVIVAKPVPYYNHYPHGHHHWNNHRNHHHNHD